MSFTVAEVIGPPFLLLRPLLESLQRNLVNLCHSLLQKSLVHYFTRSLVQKYTLAWLNSHTRTTHTRARVLILLNHMLTIHDKTKSEQHLVT